MVDVLKGIDQKTLELLTSSSPDLSDILNGRSTKAAARDSIGVVNSAYQFMREYGAPPWDRLGFQRERFIAVSSQDSVVLEAERFRVRVLILSEGLSQAPVNQVMASLYDWADNSPLRIVEFPFGERKLSLMCGHPEAEKVIKRKAKYPYLESVVSEPLPEVRFEECFFQFRTDAWVNPETQAPRWLAFTVARGIADSAKIGINRPIVKCMEAMLRLGQGYYSNHKQAP